MVWRRTIPDQDTGADIETVSRAVPTAASVAAVGTARIQETGQFFETIFALVEQQATESFSITALMGKLYTSSTRIVETMQVVSHATQYSGERTRHVAYEMQQLAALAQQLRLSVEVFQLKTSNLPGERKAPLSAW